VAHSTLLVNTLAVVLALLFASRGRRVAAMFWLALASYWTLYPVILLPPLIMLSIKSSAPQVPPFDHLMAFTSDS